MKPEVRPLVKSDISPIIEISKTTWNGHDHLPRIIGGWLSNPLCHPFVLVYNDEVVGIASIRIIDEGRTGWMEGLRIHEKVRQKGFAKVLTDYLVDVGMKLKLERLRLVTSGDNIAPMNLAESVGMKQINTYNVFWKGNVLDIDWRNNKVHVSRIDSSQVLETINQYPALVRMSKNPNKASRSVVFHWDVYEAIASNIDDIGKNASYFFGSNESEAVLCIGGEHQTNEGVEWCCTIYATNNNAFLSGLSANLELAQLRKSDSIFCIHQFEFRNLYDAVDWLAEPDHELKLVLHERYPL